MPPSPSRDRRKPRAHMWGQGVRKNSMEVREMVKIVFMYSVIGENRDEYLKITRERIKPFWESHGCESYTLWQAPEAPTDFVKEMVFRDEATMQKVMSLEDAQPIKKLFSQFAINMTRKIYGQVV